MPGNPNIEELVLRFNEALNRANVDAMMAMMTEDCLFENTFPAPDGMRFQGQAAVRAFWTEFFQESSGANIHTEEIFSCGERCVYRWVYSWGGAQPGHVRGVDVYRFEGGKIAEKLSYVKG